VKESSCNLGSGAKMGMHPSTLRIRHSNHSPKESNWWVKGINYPFDIFSEMLQALNVANALAYMHSLKLIHGDIKPVINIWHSVTENG
jgi:serine/threonine protein kinase